ncbi:MAG TPA: MFS transporter [Streptosporangiaceae bacterium]|nr:MFS transporter [Streptosporangiaceae bacterium]
MTTSAEKLTVYAAGLVQGITLVTFPAASTIFTSAAGYNLSASQYGTMFVPQVVAAIAASLAGAGLARRFRLKAVYLAGLAANLTSMALLIASHSAESDRAVAYPLLLLATAFLGLGFGLTVPAVNTFTANFHPDAVDRSVLVLNALLGLGTALAPVFVAIFTGLGFWVGLPVLAAVLLLGLIVVSAKLQLRVRQVSTSGTSARGKRSLVQFAPFAVFALLYGFCETMNGNWSQIDLTALHVSATTASLTLTVFWAMVTAGRVLFALIQRVVPGKLAYHVLPFVLAGAFALIAALPSRPAASGVIAFGLAGLGCSALLPLTISFAQENLTAIEASAASWVIACYQLGYGIAAFGVGPLRDAGITLPAIYAASVIVALALAALSFVIARRRPSPRSLHPRPHAGTT